MRTRTLLFWYQKEEDHLVHLIIEMLDTKVSRFDVSMACS